MSVFTILSPSSLNSYRLSLSTVLCSPPPTSLCPAPPLTVEGLPPHWRRSRPFLLAAFYLSSGCRATSIGRASPLQNPACYPSAGEFSLSVAGPPFPTGRRPPGRESWPSEPPSGRRLPRGEARTAHGFSLSGSPYPGAAARRRDPALCLPIIRPRWPNLRTPTMAEAPEMFFYLCVGAACRPAFPHGSAPSQRLTTRIGSGRWQCKATTRSTNVLRVARCSIACRGPARQAAGSGNGCPAGCRKTDIFLP